MTSSPSSQPPTTDSTSVTAAQPTIATNHIQSSTPNLPESNGNENTTPPQTPTASGANRPTTPPPAASSTNRPEVGTPVPASSNKQVDTFDFQKFLDQVKSRGAEPVAKYLRSFLSNFVKRTFSVNDQVKVINDFLIFISGQMRICDAWRNATDAEFDNAMEGMEKLVMNRLYEFTFTPEIAKTEPRRPITSDDLERDRVLAQRIALFGWLEEKHLDIPESEGSKGFLMFGQQELLKINHYKAPRDKLICILNCCKVIFGLIRHLKKDEGADSFVPILIFIVLKANPEHLLSNVEFINRFRNPTKLQSEAGYYLSSLMGAVSFIENMEHTSLSNITQEEFERNVENAIQSLPDAPQDISATTPSHLSYKTLPRTLTPTIPASGESAIAFTSPWTPTSSSANSGDESATPLSLPAPTPTVSLGEDAKRLLQRTGDTISKPLSAISRIFSEALDGAESKLTYLPGPFAPFELSRESSRDPGGGMPHASSDQHWAHPDQIRQYLTSDRSNTGSPAHLVPQTPGGQVGEGGPNLPPIQTPYKPRVKRIPSSSVFGTPQAGGVPPSGYAYEETPSRGPPAGAGGAGAGGGGGLPQTRQGLTMGPSQPIHSPEQDRRAGGRIPPPQFGSPTSGGGLLAPFRALSLIPSGTQGHDDFAHSSSPSPSPRREYAYAPEYEYAREGGDDDHDDHDYDDNDDDDGDEGDNDNHVDGERQRQRDHADDLENIQAQIERRAEQAAEAREQLRQIFPSVDREVVDWVLEANEGDLGRSIEALLEMSSGS